MAKVERMSAPADPTKSLPQGNWGDALVLVALGRVIAELHAPVLREPVPAALEDLLQRLAQKGRSGEGDDQAQPVKRDSEEGGPHGDQ